MSLEHIAQIAIQADVMEKIIALEDSVLLHHPVIGVADERPQDRRRHLGMIEGAEHVADIVQQCADHVFVVAPVTQCQGRRLQRMAVPIDRQAAMHEWCARISEQTGEKWRHARANQIDFNDKRPKTLADLVTDEK